MSRLFASASSQALTHAASPVSGLPISVHVWAKAPASIATDYTMISVGLSSSATVYLELLLRSTGGIRLRHNQGGSPQAASSTGTVSAGQIFQAGGVMASTSSRKTYLNGVLDGTNTVNYGTPAHGWNNTTIGRRADNGTTPQYYEGWIAEAALWAASLTDADMEALGAGVSPIEVQPDGLIWYWPLYGVNDPEIPHFGAGELTLVNAPTADAHAPVTQPGSLQVFLPATVAPPASAYGTVVLPKGLARGMGLGIGMRYA